MSFTDNFDSGTLQSFWASATNYDVEVAGGAGILSFDGAPSLNLNPVAVGQGESRQITTQPLDLRGGDTIDFDLLIGNSNDTIWGFFEDADLPNEDVALSYSIDGGATFTQIRLFLHDDPVTKGIFGSFSISIPAAAQTAATILRWWQLDNSGTEYDHWALDNVKIKSGGPVDDRFAITESGAVAGNVFADNGGGGPDSPPVAGTLAVTAVNGVAANVGVQFALASGALVQVNADGTLAYDPNGVFDHLPAPGSGGTDATAATDSFTYTLDGGETAAVTVTIAGIDSDDVITGTERADTLRGGIGDDQVSGLGGGDTLDGGAGGDRLDGGSGFDTASYLDASRVAVSLDGSVAAVGDALGDVLVSIEYLQGSLTGADTLAGNAASNLLRGEGGADLLLGQDGNDYLAGGAGADRLNGGAGAADAADYRFSAGVVLALDGSLGASGDAAGDTFSGIERILGSNAAADTLRGGSMADSFYGNGGADSLDGRGGNDKLVGGAAIDTLTGGAGRDRFDFYAASELGDAILDFTAVDDTVALLRTAFGNISQASVAAAFFSNATGNTALNAATRFIYEVDDTRLWFDADGSGAGAAVLIADLQAGATFTAADILML